MNATTRRFATTVTTAALAAGLSAVALAGTAAAETPAHQPQMGFAVATPAPAPPKDLAPAPKPTQPEGPKDLAPAPKPTQPQGPKDIAPAPEPTKPQGDKVGPNPVDPTQPEGPDDLSVGCQATHGCEDDSDRPEDLTNGDGGSGTDDEPTEPTEVPDAASSETPVVEQSARGTASTLPFTGAGSVALVALAGLVLVAGGTAAVRAGRSQA